MWEHNYQPIGDSIGLSAIVAVIPIVVLFVMLGALRKPAWMSALTALASAFVIALLVYGMPAQLAVTWLLHVTGNPLAPAWYLLLAAIVGLVAMSLMPETAPLKRRQGLA